MKKRTLQPLATYPSCVADCRSLQLPNHALQATRQQDEAQSSQAEAVRLRQWLATRTLAARHVVSRLLGTWRLAECKALLLAWAVQARRQASSSRARHCESMPTNTLAWLFVIYRVYYYYYYYYYHRMIYIVYYILYIILYYRTLLYFCGDMRLIINCTVCYSTVYC